jgi:hypothetical protein
MLRRIFRRTSWPGEGYTVIPGSAQTDMVVSNHKAATVVGPPQPILVGPAQAAPRKPGLKRGAAIQVGPQARGAWDEKGWVRESQDGKQVYRGAYLVTGRRSHRQHRFAGQIVSDQNHMVVYIADPPPQIKNHPKGPCFARKNGPWFQLHWHRPARNVDEAILYVEQLLSEALARG